MLQTIFQILTHVKIEEKIKNDQSDLKSNSSWYAITVMDIQQMRNMIQEQGF